MVALPLFEGLFDVVVFGVDVGEALLESGDFVGDLGEQVPDGFGLVAVLDGGEEGSADTGGGELL